MLRSFILYILLITSLSFALNGLLLAKDTLSENENKFLNRFEKSENLKKLQLLDGAIVITHHNKVIYKNLFGFMRNKEGKITAETLFPLASVSKPISAALIAYLVKQRKLSFDDTINSVIPVTDKRIKLKHILSHSSGYNDQFGNKAIESGRARKDLIHLLDGRSVDYSPGSGYSYSNVIFSFLEDVVHYRTQSSFKTNLSQFLAEIGIKGERICTLDSSHRMIAQPHRLVHNHLSSIDLPKYYPESVCSAAGLYLSVDHMSAFVNLMLGHFPHVLSRKEIENLIQPQVEVTDIFKKWNMKWPYPVRELKSHYALGWRTLERNQDRANQLVFHSGHLNGITSFIGFIPQKDLGIIILSNQDVMYPEPLGMEFWKVSIESLIN